MAVTTVIINSCQQQSYASTVYMDMDLNLSIRQSICVSQASTNDRAKNANKSKSLNVLEPKIFAKFQ